MTKTHMINGPAGSLELLVETPPGTARAADDSQTPTGVCVIAHPHPRYGGTLQNKVVYTLARAALAEGLCALRFNFRGVGASEGNFDEGEGETRDLLAVVAWAGREFPGLPLLLAGFSFGAAMVVKASASVAPLGVVLVAPPVAMGYLDGAVPLAPTLVLQGRADQLVSPAAVEAWVAQQRQAGRPVRIAWLAEADHFFHGQLAPLRVAAQEFFRETLLTARAGQ